MTFQKEISVGPFDRGFHIITNLIINELPIMTGIVNVFIKHTSASLTINENADQVLEKILKLILISWFLKTENILSTH